MIKTVVVTPDEYDKIKKRNEKKIQKAVKKHPKDEPQIRRCIRYCLDKHLLEDEKCNKRPLSNGIGHFHLKGTIVPYVITYRICECTDKRKPDIVKIEDIDTTKIAENKYDRK